MNEPLATCTIAIVVLTSFCSFIGFRDPGFREKFIFSPLEVLACKQYYRLITSSFLHLDWSHLILNMFSLYFFGRVIEVFYGPGQFLLIYFAAVIGGDLLSLWIHRNHEYRALGASGGVCGIIFSFIFLFPGNGVYMLFYMPGWLYAILFLVGSFLAMRDGRDHVGHDAHLGGAIIGVMTTVAMHPEIAHRSPRLLVAVLILSVLMFIYLVKNPMFLPLSGFVPDWWHRSTRPVERPPRRSESLAVDAVLEKISKNGIGSLTPEERALLDSTSAKYRHRADSKKPKSDLII